MTDTISASGQEKQVIPFSAMVGGSLSAVVQAQAQAAQTTIEYIQKYGSESVSFQYETFGDDGVPDQKVMNVPYLSIMPIPYFRVESTEIDFSAKVYEAFQADRLAPVTFQASFGNTNGKSANRDQLFHIKIRAVHTDPPEGLAKLVQSRQAGR